MSTDPGARAASVLMATAWLALVTGLVEAVILTVRKFGFGQIIGLSEHYAWMAPAGYVLVLLPPALLLAMIRRHASWLRFEWAVAPLVFLCALGVLFMFPRLHRLAMLVLAGGVALQAARLVRDHTAGFARLVRNSVPVLAAAVALVVLGSAVFPWAAERRALAALPPARAGAPNVILIILDTVRAASMSLYGYDRATTPELEGLAQRGTVFDHAFSPSPWTLPAHGAMFTGLYPHQQSSDWKTPLDDAAPTLAEVLGSAGYVAAGFAANPFYTMWEHGLDRGFVHYEGYPVSVGQVLNTASLAALVFAGRPGFTRNALRDLIGNYDYLGRRKADDITSAFLDWQARHSERPFFAFLNYIDAHDPYVPPAAYARAFAVHDPRTAWQRVTGRGADMTQEQRERLWWNPDAYDATIAFIDAEVGRLVRTLEERAQLENTLIIITSDHGEQLGERALYGHGNSLYVPALHVPLLMLMPGRVPAGRRIDEFVTLASIPATVLDLAGLSKSMPGTSLAAAWSAASVGDPLLFELRQGINVDPAVPNADGDLHGLIEDRLYLIRNADASVEMYDLARDAMGAHDLAADAGFVGQLQRLSDRLGRLVAAGARRQAARQ